MHRQVTLYRCTYDIKTGYIVIITYAKLLYASATHHGSGDGNDVINAKFSFETCMTINVIPTTPTTKLNTETIRQNVNNLMFTCN